MKSPKKKTSAPLPTNDKPFDASQWTRKAGWILAIFAALLYINTIGHNYTVDDGTVIGNNKITKKGISAIPEIFTSSYRAGFWERDEGMYRPLSVAMFAVEYSIAPDSPMPGHLMNILLYAITALVVFRLLLLLLPKANLIVPLIATLLFIAHPLHTEVVANIKSRDEILCLLFALLSLIFVVKANDNSLSKYLPLALLSYFISLLSKESAITLVAVVPMMLYCTHNFNKNVMWKITSGFIATTAVYLLVRISVLGSLTGHAELQLVNNSLVGTQSYSEQLATAIMIIGRYLKLLVLPHPLAFDYSYNVIPVVSFANGAALLSLALIILLIITAFRTFKKDKLITFGILFLFITLSLVSNVVFLIESTMAERFLYMPSLGMCIAAGVFGASYFKKQEASPQQTLLKNKLPFGILILVLLFFSFKTISRNTEWKDNMTLLSHDVKTCPNSARIRYAYGSALLIEKALKLDTGTEKTNYLNKSIAELEKGVAILPSYAEAWYHLGLAYKEMGDAPNAIRALETARSYKDFKEAAFFIASGLSYGMGKQYDKAITDLNTAINIEPDNEEAYNNKGLYLTESGQPDSALVYLNKAIALKPDFYQAWYNKGNTYAQSGNFTQAIEAYNQSLEIKPDYTDAMLNLGNSYAAQKDYSNALIWFEKLSQLDPNNPKLLYNIGVTYSFLGDTAKANQYIRRAQGN